MRGLKKDWSLCVTGDLPPYILLTRRFLWGIMIMKTICNKKRDAVRRVRSTR